MSLFDMDMVVKKKEKNFPSYSESDDNAIIGPSGIVASMSRKCSLYLTPLGITA